MYRYTRLPFGIASASAIFQSTTDKILNGLLGIICYLDVILIKGSTKEEHNSNLEAVRSRFREYGLRVKLSKCKFMERCVEFLGHCVDAEGIRSSQNKISAIKKIPTNVSELRTFLGMVHYYNKFISNLSSILQPLNGLLRKDIVYPGTGVKKCVKAFKQAVGTYR